ncbi:MAG: GtrA family protein [Sediminibacterium sp.]|jgi:putative flippase GtrA|uniref:GtrA family protein n=1 Tax=Sediminibacterium sp. TaxID=1917865 RepID=UPI002AB819C7|nr:GtrA family protein [Sediminibacterium sp.]MDZ4072182.1 GtrA family protein [Sediminibacterium sp.]
MVTFVKAQAASLAATIVDFSVFILLTEWLNCWYLAASITGTISGGVTNFLLGRVWVFDATQGKIPRQALKYVLVWIGNLLLVSGGVFVVTEYARITPLASKIMVSLIVGFTYNYMLQKKFVFK